MEATALLKMDHAAVKPLFEELEDAGDRAEQKKQRLFDEIDLLPGDAGTRAATAA